MYDVSKTELLKNRIVIMNEYCEHCYADGVELDNLTMFLQGDVLDAFRNAANSNIVLFDLSGLPDQYAYIKKRGDLLLFAKNEH